MTMYMNTTMIILVLFVLMVLLCVVCAWNKFLRRNKSNHAMLYAKLYQLEDVIALQNEELKKFSKNVELKGKHAVRVLCLGNSITLHGYKADIEWYSEWGMAASKKENDYVHSLKKMFEDEGISCEAIGINISDWERNLNIETLHRYDNEIKTADVIVVRLGENVTDVDGFEIAVNDLVQYLKNRCEQIIVTGCFWESMEKESALIKAARNNGVTFVSIDWIGQRYDVYPNIGDILYNIDNEPYVVTKDFIRAHPNDKGMKMIANEIYQHITL